MQLILNESMYFIIGLIISITIYLLVKGDKKNSQPIYEDGPKWHKSKAGTPSKGGKIFVIPLLIGILIQYYLTREILYLIYFIALLVSFYLGLKDDNDKISKKDNQSGLKPWQKLIIQFLVAIMLVGIFSKLNTHTSMALILFPFIMVGFSNATNFTDGIDGLLTSVSIIVFTTLLIISISVSSLLVGPILMLLAGLLVFLYINKYPAKMFMGDTGSLVMGVFFTICIYQLNLGIMGILLGVVYIIEMLSVIFQVSYFKYTKRKYGEGKRLLIMAPIHHHFEKLGFSENKVVILFSVLQLIVSIVVIITEINR